MLRHNVEEPVNIFKIITCNLKMKSMAYILFQFFLLQQKQYNNRKSGQQQVNDELLIIEINELISLFSVPTGNQGIHFWRTDLIKQIKHKMIR